MCYKPARCECGLVHLSNIQQTSGSVSASPKHHLKVIFLRSLPACMAAASFSLAGIALPDTLRCFQRALQSIKIEHGWLYFKLKKNYFQCECHLTFMSKTTTCKKLQSKNWSVFINKDTVPARKKDFVAHHFSHNAPHRPNIHCTHRGEDETQREQNTRRESKG